jgi:hypothetical protein
MNTEDDEFLRIEAEALRQSHQSKEPSMTDLRQAAQQALKCIERLNMRGFRLADFEDEVYAAIAVLKAALEQSAQRPWVGLTDEDWAAIGDMPDTFDQGVAWAAARLKERNHG